MRQQVYGVLIGASLLVAQRADAQCSAPPEEGSWANVSPDANSVTRVAIRFVCQDQVLNGVPCCPPGPAYYIHLWGKCEPDDCDWGEAPAQRLPGGQIYGVYDHGFAKRYVYSQIVEGGELWNAVLTHFTDPNRGDYRVDNWFTRQTSAPLERVTAKPTTKHPPKGRPAKMIAKKGAAPSAMLLDLEPKSPSAVRVTREKQQAMPHATARKR